MMVLAVFLAAFVSRVTSQLLNSPCPSVLEYGELLSDKWFAKVTLPPDRQRWSTIDIVLDRKARDLESLLGLVTTQDNLEFRITNLESNQNFGDSFKIFVTYDESAGSPLVLQIKLDQQEICDVSYKQWSADQSTTTPPEDQNSESDTDQMQGGMVKVNQRASLSAGDILEGQWPLQAAIYKIRGANIQYNCSGTLVSHRQVITGAHCLTVPNSKPMKTLDVKAIMVYLGARKLALLDDGVQIKFVEKIITHPEYDSGTMKKDLGLLQFREPVQYSNWVQPACLWPNLITNLDRIIEKIGTVVGWDDSGSGNLRLSKMNIVSQSGRLWSNPDFVKVTSKYTFCAGLANDTKTISCVGSSGNGLMIRTNGNGWNLRGVVSVEPNDGSGGKTKCDRRHFIVFTDIAQFLPWI